MAVDPGKRTEDGKVLPVDLKAGDKALFAKYAGQSVKVDGGWTRAERTSPRRTGVK